MSSQLIERTVLGLMLVALLASACGERQEAVPEAELQRNLVVQKRVAQLERVRDQAASWVSVYDPDRAWSGYTLDFFERTVPILIDMNGEIVHSWPRARVRARLRLLPDGNLLAIGLGRSIVEYDWEGNLVWEYPVEDGYPHHDVIRLSNGHTLLIKGRNHEPTDDLIEVDQKGRVIWEWRSAEFLAEEIGQKARSSTDVTHVNSIQVLPPNPWFDAGDERFRPGNILISARNLDTVVLIDRETNEVAWKYDYQLDGQHEAMMLDATLPGHGNLLIFNNGLRHLYTFRQSVVVEIEPLGPSVAWEYRADEFFSPIVGVQQPLPNGNILIGSSVGARNFEITRTGEIVWQWTPPFKTKRPNRYPYDYTPQLVAMHRRPETPVVPIEGYRHIDRMTYRFALKSELSDEHVDGRKRTVLTAKSGCREFLLPVGAVVQLGFGVDRTGLAESGHADFDASFTAILKSAEDGHELRSLRTSVNPETDSWLTQRWDLGELAFQRVELCLEEPEIRVSKQMVPNTHSFWAGPRIGGSIDRSIRKSNRGVRRDELTPEELDVRQKHLKTLGYID